MQKTDAPADLTMLAITREINDTHAHLLAAINVVLYALAREVRIDQTPDDLADQLDVIRSEAEHALRDCQVLERRLHDTIGQPAPL